MPDYSKGKIYTLRSYQTDEIYIGSTINTLPKRLGQHKDNYKCWKNEKHSYMTSFELIKYDDCYIELLEDYPCENRNQLEKREGEIIRSMDCVNKLIAGRNQKEWYIDNKDKIIEQSKQYYLDNKEQVLDYHKEYYIDNKKQVLEKNKKWRDDNKDKIKEKNNQQITCECGSIIRKVEISRHKKSKKHKEYLETLATN